MIQTLDDELPEASIRIEATMLLVLIYGRALHKFLRMLQIGWLKTWNF